MWQSRTAAENMRCAGRPLSLRDYWRPTLEDPELWLQEKQLHDARSPPRHELAPAPAKYAGRPPPHRPDT
ncbi:hypothetical protein, partial [Streptomyces platensis]|uniref:hypothetical protein n=1 Tax=Streptomyces platensis TaxID=58346 RepID=UPI001B80972F